jgi:hypothetical protein
VRSGDEAQGGKGRSAWTVCSFSSSVVIEPCSCSRPEVVRCAFPEPVPCLSTHKSGRDASPAHSLIRRLLPPPLCAAGGWERGSGRRGHGVAGGEGGSGQTRWLVSRGDAKAHRPRNALLPRNMACIASAMDKKHANVQFLMLMARGVGRNLALCCRESGSLCAPGLSLIILLLPCPSEQASPRRGLLHRLYLVRSLSSCPL